MLLEILALVEEDTIFDLAPLFHDGTVLDETMDETESRSSYNS